MYRKTLAPEPRRKKHSHLPPSAVPKQPRGEPKNRCRDAPPLLRHGRERLACAPQYRLKSAFLAQVRLRSMRHFESRSVVPIQARRRKESLIYTTTVLLHQYLYTPAQGVIKACTKDVITAYCNLTVPLPQSVPDRRTSR